MSMVGQGISRLCWVWKCSSGLRNRRRPLIHILEGEKVWHQVINPAQAGSELALWQRAVASSALLMTGWNRIVVGMPGAASRAAATCRALAATFSSALGP